MAKDSQFPDKGMKQKDVKDRVKRIMKDSPDTQVKANLLNSLVNQAERHEKGSGQDIIKEVGSMSKMSKQRWNDNPKARGNYLVNVCLKKCENKDTELCESCLRFSNLKPIKEDTESSCKDSDK